MPSLMNVCILRDTSDDSDVTQKLKGINHEFVLQVAMKQKKIRKIKKDVQHSSPLEGKQLSERERENNNSPSDSLTLRKVSLLIILSINNTVSCSSLSPRVSSFLPSDSWIPLPKHPPWASHPDQSSRFHINNIMSDTEV